MSEPSHDELAQPLAWRSAVVFLATVLLTVLLWGLQERSHQERLRLETQVTAEQVARRLSDWVADRMSISAHLAEKWELEFAQDTARFERDAARFTHRFPGFQAINWIDPEGTIRIVVPEEGNQSALNVDLRNHPSAHVREALALARRDHRLTRTAAVIELLQGGRGFATYRPIYGQNGTLLGFINAVFRMEELIDTCLGRMTVNERFHFALLEQTGELVYPEGAGVNYVGGSYAATEPVPVADLDWRLTVAPSPAQLRQHRLAAHHLILPAGVFVALLLAGFDRGLVRRKRALEVSQTQFRALFEQAPLAYFSVYPDARVQRANRVAEALFGFEMDDLAAMSFYDLLPPEGVTRTEARLLFDTVRRGENVRGEELSMRRASGEVFLAQIFMDGVYSESGEFTMFRIAVVDSTERREAEEARMHLSAAIDQAGEGVLITGPAGEIRYVNPAAIALNPGPAGDPLGESILVFLGQRGVAPGPLEEIGAAIRQHASWRGPCPIVRAGGRPIPTVATLSPVRGGTGEVGNFVFIQRDTSHEADLQSQLQQSQKLEAVGRLAAGIAHDFNNILQSLLGYATLARRNYDNPSEIALCLDEIERAGHRAAELVAQILTFSRQAVVERRPVQLRPVIEEVAALARGSLPESITLTVEFGEVQHPVRADTTQIHQVIMNLVSNALHALRDGGTLSVRYREHHLDGQESSRWPGLEPGLYMSLVVRDNGLGMDQKTLERIFEPYFSTRDIGTGTGLGLATVHGIIDNHGGAISAESTPGLGACFTILLPAVAADLAPEMPSCDGEPGSDPATGEAERRIRLLYVDDEPQIVDSMRKILERLGFEVTGFTSSTAALECFQREPERFELLVTDLTMPGLNGMALAEAIGALRPGLPVILCSGYGDSIDESIIGQAGPIHVFLRKPVSARALAGEIRRLAGPAAVQA